MRGDKGTLENCRLAHYLHLCVTAGRPTASAQSKRKKKKKTSHHLLGLLPAEAAPRRTPRSTPGPRPGALRLRLPRPDILQVHNFSLEPRLDRRSSRAIPSPAQHPFHELRQADCGSRPQRRRRPAAAIVARVALSAAAAAAGGGGGAAESFREESGGQPCVHDPLVLGIVHPRGDGCAPTRGLVGWFCTRGHAGGTMGISRKIETAGVVQCV